VQFVDKRKFLLSSWPHLFWEIFALNRRTLRFIYPSLSQTFLSNLHGYAVETNRFLTYPLKQDVLNSSELVLFLKGVAFFLFGRGSPSLGRPIQIKSSRI
jgi:hypothetical protein